MKNFQITRMAFLVSVLVSAISTPALADGGKFGDGCSAFSPCSEGFSCKPFLQECYPEDLRDSPEQYCSAFKIDDLAQAARDLGNTMSYGVGTSLAAGVAASDEIGFVYGPDDEFGCYVSVCAGEVADVAIADFYNQGFYEKFSDFAGDSLVFQQGVDFPFIELGYGTSQVLSTDGDLIGSTMGFSFGVGLVPVDIGVMQCHTIVIDGNAGLDQLDQLTYEASKAAQEAKHKEAIETLLREAAAANVPMSELGVAGTNVVRVEFDNRALQQADKPIWILRTPEDDLEKVFVEQFRSATIVELVSQEATLPTFIPGALPVPRYRINLRTGQVRYGVSSNYNNLGTVFPITASYRSYDPVQDTCDAANANCIPGAAKLTFLDMAINVDFLGEELRSIRMEVADPASCQRLCAIEQECQGFTYFKPGMRGETPLCALKTTALRKGFASAGAVSGQKVPTLFDACGFKGLGRAWEGGQAYAKQLSQLGYAKGDIASLRVPEGWSVTVYDGDILGGESMTFTKDVACLADHGFDNRVVSLQAKLLPTTEEIAEREAAEAAYEESLKPLDLVRLSDEDASSWNIVRFVADDVVYTKVTGNQWRKTASGQDEGRKLSDRGNTDMLSESGRDDTTITLRDWSDGGSVIRANFSNKSVYKGTLDQTGQSIQTIKDAQRQRITPLVTDAVNGLNVVQAEFDGRKIYQIDARTWVEPGKGTYGVYKQSLNGVHLRDTEAEYSLYIDMYTNQVYEGKLIARYIDRIGMIQNKHVMDAAYRVGLTAEEIAARDKRIADLNRRETTQANCRTGWLGSNSCVEYGDILATGIGGEQSFEGALEAYEFGCQDRYIAQACIRAAKLVEQGKPDGVDPMRAVIAYGKACDYDISTACLRKAEILQRGAFVPQDLLNARFALRAACNLGEAQACSQFVRAVQEDWGRDKARADLLSNDRQLLRSLKNGYEPEKATLERICRKHPTSDACALSQTVVWDDIVNRRFAEDYFDGHHFGFELGISNQSADSISYNGLEADANSVDLRGVFGMDKVIDNVLLGYEFGANIRLGEDAETVTSTGDRLSVENLFSMEVTGRAGYIFSERVLVYGRGGFVLGGFFVDLESTSQSPSPRNTEQAIGGLIVGGGAEIAVTDSFGLSSEFRHEYYGDLIDGLDSYSRNSANIGLRYKF